MARRGMTKPKPAKSKQSFEDVVIEMHTKIQVNILNNYADDRPYGHVADNEPDAQQSFTDSGRCMVSLTRDYADRPDAYPVAIKKTRVSTAGGKRATYWNIYWLSTNVLPTDFLQAATWFWPRHTRLTETKFEDFMAAVCYEMCKMREK